MALIAVVSNNIVSIHRETNLFDSKKKIKLALNENTEFKLTTFQKRCIHFNYCLFLANTNQIEACRTHMKYFVEKFPDSINDSTTIEAFLSIKSKNPKEAISKLKTYCSSVKTFTESNLNLALLLAQLNIKFNNYLEAIQVLEAVGTFKYTPALFSLLRKLYEKTGNVKSTENLFLEAIKFYQNKKVYY